jgi:hypothetical protein
MNIHWRLAVLTIQLFVLGLVTYTITGRICVAETWFFAGLFAVVINPQLLEPYYPRPVDVIANALIVLVLAFNEKKTLTNTGWIALQYFAIIMLTLATAALILGAGKRTGKFLGLASTARLFSQLGSAQILYSAVFLLATIEAFPSLNWPLWMLIIAWSIIIVLGHVNWQSAWATSRGQKEICRVQGMIGPCSLLVSAPNLPEAGTNISLRGNGFETVGVGITRIRRIADTWGQVHVSDRELCESILVGQTLSIAHDNVAKGSFAGTVDAGSTDKSLNFVSLGSLDIGQVVGVPLGNEKPFILYQLSSAQIEQTDVKGGAQLVVRARGNQLGVFDETSQLFHQHRWVPAPGAPVFSGDRLRLTANPYPPKDSLLVGHVIGTGIPIFLNYSSACEGHVAILGMTKMGKSTLAAKIATELATTRRVTILDQTGEYVGKKGLPRYDKGIDMCSPGISVFEPAVGEIAADRAYDFLRWLVDIAVQEYKTGDPFPRVVIIDEAHQFIPEPAGLGFSAPGRESSFKIGALLMQIRKYGISVFLISQRTAVVAKSALSQCENLIAFRSVDQTGLDYLEAVAGTDIRYLLPQLRQGEALVFGPAVTADGAVAIQVSR